MGYPKERYIMYPKSKVDIDSRRAKSFNQGRKEMADEIISRTELEKLVEEIKNWAGGQEAIDKFGDILLRQDCKDIKSLAQKLQSYLREGLGDENE